MNYGRLISLAWQMTWRYRFLWILAFFAGGAAGGSLGSNVRGETTAAEIGRMRTGDVSAIEAFARSLLEDPLIVATLILIGIAIGLLWVVVWLTCQGAMARATVDLGREQHITLRQAWEAGRRRFWRYLGLWLLLGAMAAAAALEVGSLTALILLTTSAALDRAPNGVLDVIIVLSALPLLLGVIILAITVSIVAIYAQRALAVRDVEPIAAFQDGWSILRNHPGESLLLWLISLAIGLLGSIGVGMVVVAVLGLLGAIGLGVWTVTGFGVLTITYSVLAGLVTVGIGVVVVGIANTYYWAYWTLAYLQLSGYITTLQPQPHPSAGPRPTQLAHPA
jgi:uncharacterized membrane protein